MAYFKIYFGIDRCCSFCSKLDQNYISYKWLDQLKKKKVGWSKEIIRKKDNYIIKKA